MGTFFGSCLNRGSKNLARFPISRRGMEDNIFSIVLGGGGMKKKKSIRGWGHGVVGPLS